MAITFTYGGASFTVDTPQEAAETLALLKKQETEAVFQSFMDRKISQSRQYREEFEKQLSAYDESKFAWTSDRFLAFVNRLGAAQKLALALLVTRGLITDAEMRSALNVPSNQALAGVLERDFKAGQRAFDSSACDLRFREFSPWR